MFVSKPATAAGYVNKNILDEIRKSGVIDKLYKQ
jgi:hypothetical protein